MKFFLILLVVIAVGLLVIAAPIILILRLTPWYKKQRQKEEAAKVHARQVSADYERAGIHLKKSLLTPGASEGVLAGVAFTHEIKPADKYSPPVAVIAANSALPGDFRVTRERAADTFFRRIGFAGVVQTGDAAFDAEFLLEGASRAYVQALFADARNRDAVRALFALGFDSVELEDGKAMVRKSGVATLLDLPIVTSVVERLASLRAATGVSESTLRGGVSGKRLQLAVAAGTLLSMVLAYWALAESRPLVEGWLDAAQREWRPLALGCALLVAAVIGVLWGRPAANREFGFIAPLLPVFAFGGWSAALLANQELDASALPPHEVRLLDRYVTHSKKSTYYHLAFASWREDMSRVDAPVPHYLYARLKAGQVVTVVTHAGRLGIEWIDTIDGTAP